MAGRIAALLAVAVLGAAPVTAQSVGPVLPGAAFASWDPDPGAATGAAAGGGERLPNHGTGESSPSHGVSERSLKRGLIGGVIGAAAGVVACTIISNIADDSDDPGSRITTCTASGYLLFGGVGFGVGFLIGSATG